LIGAERGEHAEDRATHRNGYRQRRWDTRAGEIELQITKLRRGSYFPSFLQPRKCSEQALAAIVRQSYVGGVSTRRVDQLVESLGLRISKSEVSRICALLDEQVKAFRERPLEGRYPYLFVDAKVEKVRAGGRVVRKCVVIAHGCSRKPRRTYSRSTRSRPTIGASCFDQSPGAFQPRDRPPQPTSWGSSPTTPRSSSGHSARDRAER
jgi:putative transposase